MNADFSGSCKFSMATDTNDEVVETTRDVKLESRFSPTRLGVELGRCLSAAFPGVRHGLLSGHRR
jgi:hypothetical protein